MMPRANVGVHPVHNQSEGFSMSIAIRTIPTSLALIFACLVQAQAISPQDSNSSKDAKLLFDGHSLDGWEHVGPGKFVIENGLLRTEGGMGLLWYTREKLGNCVIRVVYKTATPRSNSGIYIRIADRPKEPWYAVHHGFEVQIMDSGREKSRTGSIYTFAGATAQPAKSGEWNTLEITLKGNRVQTAINGIAVSEFDSSELKPQAKDTTGGGNPARGPAPRRVTSAFRTTTRARWCSSRRCQSDRWPREDGTEGADRMASTLIAIMTVLAGLGPASEPSAPCNESIRQQDLKADLFFLAGDAFQGRLTGTAGNTLAAEFIASRFDRLGLKRMGSDGSYFQPFLLSTATLGPSNKLEVIRYGAGPMRFRTGQDFFPLQISPSGELRTRLAFAGFGISDLAHGHDDYRNADVRGVTVLVLAHEPGENDPQSSFDGLVLSEASNLLRKVLTAQEKGASGVLIVTDVHNHTEPENFEALAHGLWPEKPPRIPQYTLQDWAERVRIPAAMISIGLARTLLGDGQGSFEEIARSSEGPREVSVLPGEEVALTTDVSHHVVPDRNVVAALEGCDPKLKDEWVVISCHLDHNGADGDRVYNGADDNGSGCVGLLEMPRPTHWPRSRATAPSDRSCSRRSTRRSAACWGLMPSWSGR